MSGHAAGRSWFRLLVGGVLAIVLAAVCLFVWQRRQEHAAETVHAKPVPRSLVTSSTSSRAAAPPVVGESSAAASQTRQPGSPATTASQPAVIVHPIVPTHIWISGLKPAVNTSVSPGQSAYKPDLHQKGRVQLSFPVPPDLTTVTWWQSGPDASGRIFAAPKPGSLGSLAAVMTMHSALGDKGYGVGNNLGKLRPGQKIRVEGKDNQGHETLDIFAVTLVSNGLDKTKDALYHAITTAPHGTRLILITCSGSVSYSISSSNFNTAVYATLVSSSRLAAGK